MNEPTFKTLFEYAQEPESCRVIARSNVLGITIECDSKAEMLERVASAIMAMLAAKSRDDNGSPFSYTSLDSQLNRLLAD